MNRLLVPSAVIVIMAFVMSIAVYPKMPDIMPTHWNVVGQVDGWMPKIIALFIMPVASFLILLLVAVIPKIDPLKENIKKFRNYFDIFILMLMAFLFYLHILVLFWSVGITFNIMQVLSPAFAVLFYYIGVMLEKTRKNWFIGIRTPWTLKTTVVAPSNFICDSGIHVVENHSKRGEDGRFKKTNMD